MGLFSPCIAQETYIGKYCEGEGDGEYLRLIDESFAFFHPNPIVPNLSMLYQTEWNTFVEGTEWRGWWIQNSYGFSYAVTPFLQEPWFSTLQRSWDLFWNKQGNGKEMALWGGSPTANGIMSSMVAPDGCLGDCARPGEIVYKQGDGDLNKHDWFYEATAAGVVMQAEILLAGRNGKALAYYLPKMARACDFIEKVRDPKNNLFLVGPACNLIAPSYGGVKQDDGSFGKGYLAGLSITYLAALDRMVELYKLFGDQEKLAEYKRRQNNTRESLSQLLTPAGYFVKSLEPDGTKHGVLGQKQYGYLEGVANADAVAMRVVDNETAESIYKQIAEYPGIRPFDFLLTNAPGLDDTYYGWGRTTGEGLEGINQFGDWVNGGVWGTVEGRAILMYARLGKFEDIRKSAIRAMKWAKDFRMDAPFSQRGENTDNSWFDAGKWLHGDGVKIMIDNFAIPAATIRGLFDYEYLSDCLVLRPRVPGSITRYKQKDAVRFGEKKIYLTCLNGGPKVKSATINGKAINIKSPDALLLFYDQLPQEAYIEIITYGGWPQEYKAAVSYPLIPALVPNKNQKLSESAELVDSLKKPYAILNKMHKALIKKRQAEYEQAFVSSIIETFEAYRVRAAMEVLPGYYRPGNDENILKFYALRSIALYDNYEKRMVDYAEKGDPNQKQIAMLFLEAKNSKR
jgi:hypothetical protein